MIEKKGRDGGNLMTTSVPVPAADPRRTALLVMDYQTPIVRLLPETEGAALVRRVADAITTVRRAGGTIAYVRVGFTPEELAAIPAENKMFSAIAGRGGMDADGPATAVVGELAPADGDIVVRKTRVGSFSTTDLHDRLTRRGVTTLALAGISTSGVVLSTVRDAADRDYRLLVLSDGCADPDAQAHEVLMERVFPRQADVLGIAELPHLLEPAAAAG
ncbi:cysteine hydrolase family protein [Streptomyces sulfonofaciens]|nr:cysteine hydrolase [Streptomyces sulfonofaciens]